MNAASCADPAGAQVAAASSGAPLVVLVAGEASGDFLGAELIGALRERHPHLRFAGVAGPRMREAGCEVWWEAEELAVMGLSEVVRHLPRLLRLRRDLLQRIVTRRPALMVGIDAPEFNLRLEARLRAAGISTAHYVSPQVWAWREGRVHLIRRAVDLMLCLFPFEQAFYDRHGVPATFVGHPLAAQIPEITDRQGARARLHIPAEVPLLAVLPGSRLSEVERQAAPFAGTVAWLAERIPGLRAVLPLAHPSLRASVEQALQEAGVGRLVQLVEGDARSAVTAADAALVTSGTATLETALLRRPMVVAYQTAPLTLLLLRALRLVRVRHFAMPNLLASEPVVPEFLQSDVRPEKLGPALLALFEDSEQRSGQLREFATMHRILKTDPSASAARALSPFLPPSHAPQRGGC